MTFQLGLDVSGTFSRGVDRVIVTGYTISGWARASALDALESGSCVIAREWVADRNPDTHKTDLLDLQARYAADSFEEVLLHLRATEVSRA